jgi:hypothetical protein
MQQADLVICGQERRSLLEQHRKEIEELSARLAAAESSHSSSQAEDMPSASHENSELERTQLGHELESLKRQLETTRVELAEERQARADAEGESSRWQEQAERVQQQLLDTATITRTADKAKDMSIEIVDKTHREALKKSQVSLPPPLP